MSSLKRTFPTKDADVLAKLDELFPGKAIPSHDFWRIADGEEHAVLIGDATYNELLYTEAIIEFLDRQSAATPWFVQYNLFTPHLWITEPPDLSDDFEFQYSNTCNGLGDGQKALFCRAMLYAQERMMDVIDKIKAMGVWGNTIVLVSSDNGPTPLNYGDTLPLRGIKSVCSMLYT